MEIKGVIGFDFNATDAVQFLSTHDSDSLDIRINSPGGYVDEADEIYAVIRDWSNESPGRKVTTKAINVASAASYIFMAGDERLVYDVSSFHPHNAWGIAIGNKHELAETAKVLDKIDHKIAGVYSERASMGEKALSRKKALELMDEDLPLNPDEMLNLGLATGKVEGALNFKPEKIEPVAYLKGKVEPKEDKKETSILNRIKNLFNMNVEDRLSELETKFDKVSNLLEDVANKLDAKAAAPKEEPKPEPKAEEKTDEVKAQLEAQDKKIKDLEDSLAKAQAKEVAPEPVEKENEEKAFANSIRESIRNRQPKK